MSTSYSSSHFSEFNHVSWALKNRIGWTKVKTQETFQFLTEWKTLVTACGLQDSVAVEHENTALSIFTDVMMRQHASEDKFNSELLYALYRSLGGEQNFDKLRNENGIVLKKRKIGFYRNLERSMLGFHEGYGIPYNTEVPHASVVFAECSRSSSVADYIVKDVTAIVQLKVGKGNCKPFELRNGVVRAEPKLCSDHISIGQTLLYSLDVLHCLARRGVVPQDSELPVTVIGGRLKDCSYNNYYQFVDTRLHLPESCIDVFRYSVNAFGLFPPESKTSPPFDSSNVHNVPLNVQRASALYIRTMRIGVEFATEIEEKLYSQTIDDRSLYPVSLCCRNLSIGKMVLKSADLVASPIPGAIKRAGLTINQGELFEIADSHCLQLRNESNICCTFTTKVTGPVLVKVNCRTVHEHLVEPKETKSALLTIAGSRDKKLKTELAKVLIAYRMESPSTFVTVMRDLRKDASGPFLELKPITFKDEIQILWEAFSVLVTNVLLPMAKCNVIHADIRAGWEKTYNIVYRRTGSTVELRLIDYESLATYTEKVLVPCDRRSINVYYFTTREISAFQFVWWQVLLVAYVWQSRIGNNQFDSNEDFAGCFVDHLFSEADAYTTFRKFIGNDWDKLRHLSEDCHSFMAVTNLLEILSTAFSNESCTKQTNKAQTGSR